MHSIEFNYKKVIGGLAPIIPVTLYGRGVSSMFEAYVDSGAVVSLFDASVADLLNLPWRSGKKRSFIVGDGKLIHGGILTLPMQIGVQVLRVPIAFSNALKVGFNLLGRAGIFEKFSEVVFQEKRHKIIFRI